ncbi:hypothetical protein EB061_07325, partial [bacterium]|nr:hypothetical protein [bacterium]
MIKRYQNSAGVMTRIADVTIVIASWLIAYPIRFDWMRDLSFLPRYSVPPSEGRYLSLLPFLAVVWAGGFHFFGVYRYDRVIRRSTEVYTLIRAHLGT